MPLIRVEMFEGRTADQKAELARALTEAAVKTLGCSPEAVDVMMFDVPKSHWATAGVVWSQKGQKPVPGS